MLVQERLDGITSPTPDSGHNTAFGFGSGEESCGEESEWSSRTPTPTTLV